MTEFLHVRRQSRRRLRSHGFREQVERERQRVRRLRVRGEPSFGRHELFLKRSLDLFFQAFVFRSVFSFPQHFCRFCQQGGRVRKICGLNQVLVRGRSRIICPGRRKCEPIPKAGSAFPEVAFPGLASHVLHPSLHARVLFFEDPFIPVRLINRPRQDYSHVCPPR